MTILARYFFLAQLIVIFCYPHKLIAQSITLTFASWGPGKHYIAEARSAWVSTINKKFKGRLNIVEYPSGQLYGPKEMHRALAKGVVDMGVILQPRIMALIPMMQGPGSYTHLTLTPKKKRQTEGGGIRSKTYR